MAKDPFDGFDGEPPESDDEWCMGYRRVRGVITVERSDDPAVEEAELRERMRVLEKPQTLDEKIQAYIYGNIWEFDGKIEVPAEALEKCGITLEELLLLKPELAPRKYDSKGRPI